MKYPEFVVLDIETSGVDAKLDDIIEFAGVRIDATGKVIDELTTFVHSTKPLSPIVRAITGIHDGDLSEAPKFEEVRDKIIAFIGDAPIVGHNIGFDFEFLNTHGCGLKNPLLDTLELAHTVLPTQDYYSLEYLSHTHDFPHKPSHRAMDDVLATVDLFNFLNTCVAALIPATRQEIVELVPTASWSWGWLVEAPMDFAKPVPMHAGSDELTIKLVEQIQASTAHLPEIEAATTGKRNFIEGDWGLDAVAGNLAYATKHEGTVVVVPVWYFHKTNWTAMGAKLGQTFTPFLSPTQMYRDGAERELLALGLPLSSIEAKLVTKIIIWKSEWNQDFQKLFLTRDERYQWEQKIAPYSAAGTLPTHGVIVTTPFDFFDLPDISSRQLVTSIPTHIEDADFALQTKTLSLNYFSALVSSRRDFVHQHMTDAKLKDQLFKILNHLGSALTDLGQTLVEMYKAWPQEDVFDKSLELNTAVVGESWTRDLGAIADGLEKYMELITTQATIPALEHQTAHTAKLIDHLRALQNLSGEYRYFLFADDTRFFLDIAPTQPDYTRLQAKLGESDKLLVLSPSLTHAGRFDYFKPIFGEFASTIIIDTKPELILAKTSDPHLVVENWLPALLQKILMGKQKTLVAASSPYEAQDIFASLFDIAHDQGAVLESHDTVGNLSRLAQNIAKPDSFMLIGYHYWLERAKWYAQGFNRVIVGKMPFDQLSKPQFKILAGDRAGFNRYSLPRAIMKLKTVLQHAKQLGVEVILVDGRLVEKMYGPEVIRSLNGFTVTPEDLDNLGV